MTESNIDRGVRALRDRKKHYSIFSLARQARNYHQGLAARHGGMQNLRQNMMR
jgi:hypothetical protein